MPATLLFPLFLRLSGPIAFVIAAIIAGAMNRSFMLVPLLAMAATATTIAIRKLTPSPAMNLQTLLNPDAREVEPNPFRGMGQRFGLGLIGYGIAFGLSALIAALFQSTEFEAQIQVSDLFYLAIPAVIAAVGAWFAARTGLNQMAGMMDQMQEMMATMQAQQQAANDDAFTVDGEVITPKDDKPS